MRTKKHTERMRRLDNRARNLEKKNRKLDEEMVQRGEEITKMIRIFLMVEQLLPEEQRGEFRKVAVGYAVRSDKGRGKCYCEGEIDFRGAWHEGTV